MNRSPAATFAFWPQLCQSPARAAFSSDHWYPKATGRSPSWSMTALVCARLNPSAASHENWPNWSLSACAIQTAFGARQHRRSVARLFSSVQQFFRYHLRSLSGLPPRDSCVFVRPTFSLSQYHQPLLWSSHRLCGGRRSPTLASCSLRGF